jgi:hypothetical protein
MRALLVTALLLFPAAAHAESFLEILGGVAIPVGDNNWTKLAESSPKLGARVGAVNETGLGAMLQFDWTPVNLDNNSFGIGTFSAHRFRILAAATIHKPVGPPHLIASGRAGVGIDIAHASASGSALGVSFNSSDTDTNIAFELGGGLWYDIGSAQLGGELALPISNHNKQGNGSDGNYPFQYASYDIDILFGVRLVSH